MRVDLRRAALGLSAACFLWACGQTTSDGDGPEGEESGGSSSESGGSKTAQTGGRSNGSGGTTNQGSGGAEPGSGSASSGGGNVHETGGTDGTGGAMNPDQGRDAVWYYFETGGNGFMVNVQSPGQAVEVPGGLVVNTIQSAWSADGREAAFLVDNEIVFYDLAEEAEVTGRAPALGYHGIHGYLPGVGAVVTGGLDTLSFVAVVRPDGDEVRLDERSASLAGFQVGVPPVKDTVVWTETGSEFVLSFASFAEGDVSATRTLGTFSASPPLSEAWSPDGSWYSFGISGGEGSTESGMYLWRVGSDAPVRVTPEGASYAPFFPFSPDSAKLAVWVANGDEGSISSVNLRSDEPPLAVPIRTGASLSPAVWTPFGALLYEEESAGFFQNVGGDEATEALPFEGFVYGCEIFWLSETQFFHDGCGKSPSLWMGTVNEGAIEETVVAAEAAENYGLSPDRACLVRWESDSLFVGPATGDLGSVESLGSDREGIGHVSFTPDSASLVWAQSDGIYRAELEDCSPKGEPIQVHDLDDAVTRAIFITPEP